MSAAQPIRRRIDVPRRHAGVRLDHVLAELFPERTRSQLQKLVRRGEVKLNGRRVLRSNLKLAGGEEITIQEGGDAGQPAPQADQPISVLHEDEHFVVLNKPAGMLTHPTEKHAGGTVADIVEERYGPLPSTSDAYRPGIVHRLDRETGGVLVIARNQRALDNLRLQFRHRTVEKRYLAIVHGRPAADRFDANSSLGPVAGQRDLQGIQSDGRPAQTTFEVLQRWRDFSLVECMPSTGRRHQLRVHLWSLGHPIAGDKLYRPATGSERVRALRFHALHAKSLAFDSPSGAGRVEFQSALPQELEQFLAGLAS